MYDTEIPNKSCGLSLNLNWWISYVLNWCLHWQDNAIKWQHFPRYWPFVRGIHRSSMNSPHKGQWRGDLMCSLICVSINGWISNSEAGDLRRHRAHYYVSVMIRGPLSIPIQTADDPPPGRNITVTSHAGYGVSFHRQQSTDHLDNPHLVLYWFCIVIF